MRLHKDRIASPSELEILAREPPNDAAIALCVECFHDVSTCRSYGMAAGPVPITAVYAWCDFNRLDWDNTMTMLVVVRRLDRDRIERENNARAHKGA